MKCLNCGEQNSDYSARCETCGIIFNSDAYRELALRQAKPSVQEFSLPDPEKGFPFFKFFVILFILIEIAALIYFFGFLNGRERADLLFSQASQTFENVASTHQTLITAMDQPQSATIYNLH